MIQIACGFPNSSRLELFRTFCSNVFGPMEFLLPKTNFYKNTTEFQSEGEFLFNDVKMKRLKFCLAQLRNNK